MGMLSGAAPVGVVHSYLGCHLSGRRQGRNADFAAADTDAAGSGDADAAGPLTSRLPYQGEEKGAADAFVGADDADGVFLPRLTSQGKTRTKCYRS